MLPVEMRAEACQFTPERVQDICVFCDDFDISKGTGLFYKLFPELKDTKQVIEETPHHVLLPDIGPLVEDHLLVVSKSHVSSYASLPEEGHAADYESLVGRVIGKMEELHPGYKAITFEHGVGFVDGQLIRCGGCGRTDHAHLHVLPVFKEECTYLFQDLALHIKTAIGFQSVRLEKPYNIGCLRSATGDYPYLMIGDSIEGMAFIQNDSHIIPSQYIRQWLGERLGIEHHNWKILLAESPQIAQTRIAKTLQSW